MATRNGKKSLKNFVVEQVEAAQKQLVKLEEQASRRIVAVAEQAEKNVESILAKGKTQRKELIAQVEKQVDVLKARLVEATGVASRSQLRDLNREVAKLSKKVDGLLGKNAA